MLRSIIWSRADLEQIIDRNSKVLVEVIRYLEKREA